MIISPAAAIPTFNAPIPSFAGEHVSTNVLMALVHREEHECVNIFRCRTTTSIVLSCLATIFLCTWVALHLDTPSTNRSWWRSFQRRFGWMITALIAPEFVAGLAMRDLLDAKKNQDTWNANFMKLCKVPSKTVKQTKRESNATKYDTRWTLAHGFLAGMGGIRLYRDGDSDGDAQIFRPNQSFFEDPEMRLAIQQIGLISQDDIADKSKGDGIAKFFVVLQTAWFIIQCLARWAAHLYVTELEVMTLAYAALNIPIYILWWHKPQSLSVPFRISVEKEGGRASVVYRASEEEVSIAGIGEGEQTPILRHSSSNALSESETLRGSDMNLTQLPHEINWVQPTYSRSLEFFISLYADHGSWVFPTLSGAIFGALHLIPLRHPAFPSGAEKKMWQVSAFFVTLGPLGLLIIILSVTPLIGTSLVPGLGTEEMLVLSFTLPYAAARILLFVITFTTLRALPKEALQNVEWTRFIVHF